MEDTKGVYYDVGFKTNGAESSLDRLTQKADGLEKQISAAEMGAQQMGAGTVSACQTAQTGVSGFSEAVQGAANAINAETEAAQAAEDTTREFGGGFDNAGNDTDEFRAKVQGVAAELDSLKGALNETVQWIRDTSDAAKGLGDTLGDTEEKEDHFKKKTEESNKAIKDLGASFRSAMANGLEAGQSITKSFGTGISGALDFTRKKFTTFTNDVRKGVANIGNAFKNPIQTIKNNLVKALQKAKESTDDSGDSAEDAEGDYEDLGDAGESAGNQIKESISGAIKAFVGFEAIKKGIELVKQFSTAAIEAFSATETTVAKFDTLFTSEAADWVDNYSDAVHRSTDEVKSFMVQNDAMYRNMGITADAAQELSEITTSLAYDFGNAFHMEDAEALSVLQSAIEGSTDALTEYGVTLDNTALKNSAAALGLGTNIDTLDDAAMAQVRLNAILEQTGDIQQAAITQTGGLTNSMKSLKGEMSGFMSSAGEKFVPVVEKAVSSVINIWPTVEPMLLSLVEILTTGLEDAIPILTDLGQDLIPVLISALDTLFTAASPILKVLGDIVGTVLPPLASIINELVSMVIPPLIQVFDELNENAIQPLMPVVEEVSEQLLPVLGMALSAVADVIGPLISAFIPLLENVLPVFGTLVSQLAATIIPPLTEMIGILTSVLGPVIDLGMQIVDDILPVAETLIGTVGTVLSGVLIPAFEVLSPVLSVVAGWLGTVVGWISDLLGFFANGVSKVVDWFAGLFGGAKESTGAVQELTGAVSDLDGAAGTETSLAIDTSEYTSDVSKASEKAETAVSEAMTAAREIADTNYQQMSDDAETAYAQMTLSAEDAWDRMTAAATNGADLIIIDLRRIAQAADALNGMNITVSGANIPHNAKGTDNFEGGWTHMNEEGGELAYLPSGTAIIPADQTDEIIQNSTSSSTEYADNSTFAPQISITLSGNADPDIADLVAQKVKETVENLWEEKQEQERHNRVMQGAYAR